MYDTYYGEKYFNYISAFIPVFLLSIFVEVVISQTKNYKTKNLVRFNDAISSISTGIIQETLSSLFIKTMTFILYIYVWENYSVFRLSNNWFTNFLCFLSVDFGYYWFHRCGHEINAMWGAHVVHHSSEEYNYTTALRQGAIQYTTVWIFYTPLALFFPPNIFALHSQLNRIYQFFIHTRVVDKLGFLELILNTPSHHRVHHGRNPKYIDKNYGGILIVFDKIFGTFQAEEEEVVYGITKPVCSWNPIRANLHYWQEIYELSLKFPSQPKLLFLWRGPSWSPDGKHITIPEITPNTQNKYDQTAESKIWNFYIVLHMAITIVFLRLLGSNNISVAIVTSIAGIIIWSLGNFGMILDRNENAFSAEIKRILVTILLVFFVEKEFVILNQIRYFLYLVYVLSLVFIFKNGYSVNVKKNN